MRYFKYMIIIHLRRVLLTPDDRWHQRATILLLTPIRWHSGHKISIDTVGSDTNKFDRQDLKSSLDLGVICDLICKYFVFQSIYLVF